MSREKPLKFLCGLLIAVILFLNTGFNFQVMATNTSSSEKVSISILGDSISTYENFSNKNAAKTTNSYLNGYAHYYYNNRYNVGVNDTWWRQAADKVDAQILVNNSYSGSKIFESNLHLTNAGYVSRAENLHLNQGKNAGKKPDIIAVFLGTNDFHHDKGNLGENDVIDYKKLIQKTKLGYKYATPKTSVQAYAIMLHKIKQRYPNAEIFCFTLLNNCKLNEQSSIKLKNFNSALKSVADYMNCYVVDLYTDTGITASSESAGLYFGDRHLHPNRNGMTAIANCFLSALYKNSKYFSEKENFYNVEYETDNAILINEGTKKRVLKNDSFKCGLTQVKYGEPVVKITMGENDITDLYQNGEINIPQVTDDIKISLSVNEPERAFNNYRWELSGLSETNFYEQLTNICLNENLPNMIFQQNGVIVNEFISDGYFKVEKELNLYYDKPWQIFWKTEFSHRNSPVFFSSENNSKTDENTVIHIQKDTDILAIGRYIDGKYYNYGIDLSEYNIDYTQSHTYKLVNKPEYNGDNHITLFVDGKEIGDFKNIYIDGEYQTSDIKCLSKNDFNFLFMGTEDRMINNCKLSYIQIWEDTVPDTHIHNYVHLYHTSPTCVVDETDDAICDCGHIEKTVITKATGHIINERQIITEPDIYQRGKETGICSVCGLEAETLTLSQQLCSAPALKQIKIVSDGIQLRWSEVEGADAYRIYRKSGKSKWELIDTLTAPSSSYTDLFVKSGVKYTYTVRASNEGGSSSYNAKGLSLIYLSTPKITKVTTVKSGIYISWNKVTGAEYYRVYRKDSKGKWVLIKKTKSLSYTDKSVKSGKNYTYTVIAANGDVRSLYNTKGVSTKFIKTPSLRGIYTSRSGITFKWDKISGVTGYVVYRKTGSSGWKKIATVKGSTKTSYLDKSTKKGKTYTYTVRAYYGSYYSYYESKGLKIKDRY